MPTIAAASCSTGFDPVVMRERYRCEIGTTSGAGEDDRQRQGRAKGHALDVRDIDLGIKSEPAQAIEQGVDGHPGFHAGQVHAEAHVYAEAEADVLAYFPEHVVAIGIDVLPFIAVGRTKE